MMNIALAVCALASTTLAWPYEVASGYGIVLGNDTQGQLFQQASMHPNATASVPLSLGNHNVTFRVNVSDVAMPGVDTNISNPHAILTTWDLAWPSNTSYQQIFGNVTDNTFCISAWFGSFSSSAASSLKGDGDCAPAFGADCVNALRALSADCGSTQIPSACQSAFNATSGYLTLSYNESTSEPFGVYGQDSPLIAANNISGPYQAATQQLQFALFRLPSNQSGQASVHPVCVRASAAGNGSAPGTPKTSGGITDKAGMATWMYLLAGSIFAWILT